MPGCESVLHAYATASTAWWARRDFCLLLAVIAHAYSSDGLLALLTSSPLGWMMCKSVNSRCVHVLLDCDFHVSILVDTHSCDKFNPKFSISSLATFHMAIILKVPGIVWHCAEHPSECPQESYEMITYDGAGKCCPIQGAWPAMLQQVRTRQYAVIGR